MANDQLFTSCASQTTGIPSFQRQAFIHTYIRLTLFLEDLLCMFS